MMRSHGGAAEVAQPTNPFPGLDLHEWGVTVYEVGTHPLLLREIPLSEYDPVLYRGRIEIDLKNDLWRFDPHVSSDDLALVQACVEINEFKLGLTRTPEGSIFWGPALVWNWTLPAHEKARNKLFEMHKWLASGKRVRAVSIEGGKCSERKLLSL